VIAHRGSSRRAPENTLAAFRLARREAADGVELDVMRCGSGEVVVFHDADLRRLGGRKERIARAPLELLREVDLGGGEHIPLLSEVLEELGPDMLVNIELKLPRLGRRGLAEAVTGLIRRHAMGSRALVSSFHPWPLVRMRVLAPEVPTGLLFHEKLALPLRQAWSAAWIQPVALHPEATLCDTLQIQDWHRRGYAVNAWTVDDPAEVAALALAGVDGIITNDPVAARAALAQ
jgi:glycerophosphoryl diester phosphodiesterase